MEEIQKLLTDYYTGTITKAQFLLEFGNVVGAHIDGPLDKLKIDEVGHCIADWIIKNVPEE